MKPEELERDLMQAAESVGETWDQIAGRLIGDMPELIALWKAAEALAPYIEHGYSRNAEKSLRLGKKLVEALNALEGK